MEKDFDRQEYKREVQHMKQNDLCYIKSIDRRRRNYRKILEQSRILPAKKQPSNGFVVAVDAKCLLKYDCLACQNMSLRRQKGQMNMNCCRN